MKKGILIKGKIPPKKHRYLIQFKVPEFKRSAVYLPLLGEEPQKSLSRKTIRKHIKITRRISFTSLCKVYPTYCPKINIGQSPNLLLFTFVSGPVTQRKTTSSWVQEKFKLRSTSERAALYRRT